MQDEARFKKNNNKHGQNKLNFPYTLSLYLISYFFIAAELKGRHGN